MSTGAPREVVRTAGDPRGASADGPRPGRMLVVCCPDWSVTAAGCDPAEPAVVVRANRVVAVTPGARTEGVRRGQRRRDAQGRCPGLVVIESDPARDTRAFESVAAALEELTPRLAVRRPGVCVIPTRGPARYHGGDGGLAAAALAVVSARVPEGTPVGVGVADGAFAAWVAARDATGTDPVVVPPGASAALLAPRRVGLLAAAVPGAPVDLLERLGVRTVGAFAALDAAVVGARFGTVGLRAHRVARGLDPDPVVLRHPPPDLTVEARPEPPLDRVETAVFWARRLAEDLAGRLTARGLVCRELVVEVLTDAGDRRSRAWRGDRALTAAAVAERVRWQLDAWLTGPPATRPRGPVAVLRLVPAEVAPDRGTQAGFWGTDVGLDDRAVAALTRLEELLSPGAVGVPERTGGRDPDTRQRTLPAGAVDLTTPRPVEPDPAPWPGSLPGAAPVVVHRHPVPAEVLDRRGRPVTVSGRGVMSAPPHRVRTGGRELRVTGWAGPWLVDERWWDPARHRRRARCQVTLEDGSAHLLVLEGGRWSVAATYD